MQHEHYKSVFCCILKHFGRNRQALRSDIVKHAIVCFTVAV